MYLTIPYPLFYRLEKLSIAYLDLESFHILFESFNY